VHLGIALFATDLTTDIREVARAAEDAGFESLFVAEHTHIPVSRATPYPMGGELPEVYWHTLDPFVALSAAAAVTERLRLGTGICIVPERDPIVTAKEVASLDHLSGGRVLFGIGVGWNVEEMADHGTDFTKRYSVMRDRVRLMQQLWANDVASYDGEFAKVSPSWQWPKPRQQPMRVLVGGSGKVSMRHAIEYGTDWMPMPSKESFGDRLDQLAELADAAGKPVPAVTMYWSRPRREILDHYEELGVERTIMLLPFEPDVMPTLREWAKLVRPS
jgi:probable F420-dependent oxidoreductase